MSDKPGAILEAKPIITMILLALMILLFSGSGAHAGRLEAAICGKADLVSGEYEKTLVVPAGAKGFTVAVTSRYPKAVMVLLTWEAVNVKGMNNGQRLSQDTLALGPGQTKFVPFRNAKSGLVAGLYRIALSVAGQPEKPLGFVVKAVPSVAAQPQSAPASAASESSGKEENVSEALARVFKTKEGPEAAQEGIKVVGDFFDKDLSTPARKSKNTDKAKATTSNGRQQTSQAKQTEKHSAPQVTPEPTKQEAVAPGADNSDPDKPEAPKATQTQPTSIGGIELVCARSVDSRKAPIDTPGVFSTDEPKIFLAMRSTDPTLKDLVNVKWLVAQAEGMPSGKKLSDSRTILRVNDWNTAIFMPPNGGFWPGNYRVEVLKNGKVLAKVDFSIQSPHKTALLLDEVAQQNGANLAHEGLGGKVVSVTSQANSSSWSKQGLNDGYGYGGEDCKPACGWASSDRKFPQEIVFSFNQDRSAGLKALVLDCESCSGDEKCLQSLPRLVEIWVSNQSADSGYKLTATRRLRPVASRQVIPLSGVRAKFLKLVLKSNYGGTRRTQLAEVEIIEEPGPDSIVKDAPIDLALPSFGGAVLRYTSQKYGGEAVNILRKQHKGRGWRSKDDKLPQEFTFCLRDDGEALIDRLELNLDSGFDPASRPKQTAVLISTSSPTSGFAEVARVELPSNSVLYTIPIMRKARFIKLRILENQGGRYTSLGKVAIIEGRAPGYNSLLLGPVKPLASISGAAPEPDPSLVTSSVQPGLSPGNASALELGKRLKAPFKDYSQRHYYFLDLRGDQPGMLNLELMGLPFLRTRLTLKDSQGRKVAVFDPERNSSPKTIVSWRVNPGKYLLVAESTPANIVLAWDVSGSMAKHTDLLQKAVTGFLEDVQPSENLSLIAFNNNLHVLTKGFTNDKGKLLDAVSGKFKAEMATRLYDAVEKGIKLLSEAKGAGAMVIMTDGVDMGSVLDYPQFWKVLDDNPVRLFTIGLGGELKVSNPKVGFSGSCLLRHMAQASGGRFIYVPNVDQLVAVYKQVAQELMSGTTYYLQPTWTFKPGSLLVKTEGQRIAQIAVPPRIELVLDGSGSMNRRIGGKSRMEIAKEVLTELIEQMPPDVEVALRVYGHRIREGRKGDCQDTELVYPFGKLNKSKLIAQIKAVKPLGTTPIAYSLSQTVKDFGQAKGEKTIILVTDGKEECKGNLVKTIDDLRSQGLDVRLHVVGFAVKDPKTREQMEQAAQAGKGRYLNAADQQGLKKAIAKTLAIPYTVRDSRGQEIAKGAVGEELSLPAGYYNVVLDTPQGELVQQNVLVEQGKSTLMHVTKDGPKIGVQVMARDLAQ